MKITNKKIKLQLINYVFLSSWNTPNYSHKKIQKILRLKQTKRLSNDDIKREFRKEMNEFTG